MGFFSGLAVIIVGCAVAVFVLPRPPYGGRPRGCMGGALQRAMEEEKEREKNEKAAK